MHSLVFEPDVHIYHLSKVYIIGLLQLFVAVFSLKEVVFSSKNELVTHLCQIGKSFELVPLGYLFAYGQAISIVKPV